MDYLRKVIVENAINNIKQYASINHVEFKEAIEPISKTLHLTPDEIIDVTEAIELDGKIKPTKENPYPNSVYFSDPNDIDSAVGMLMYNNVPWDAKGSGNDRNYIQFQNQDSLNKGMKAIGRKWDFVDNDVRTVGTVAFDNIKDYKKVLDFMNKQGMLVNYGDTTDLDEDPSLVEDEDTGSTEGKSVVAKLKNNNEKPDPVRYKTHRASVIRQRLK